MSVVSQRNRKCSANVRNLLNVLNFVDINAILATINFKTSMLRNSFCFFMF